MSQQVVVVGSGRVGWTMKTLGSSGHEVLGIDPNEKLVQDLSQQLPSVHLTTANATDGEALRGLREARGGPQMVFSRLRLAKARGVSFREGSACGKVATRLVEDPELGSKRLIIMGEGFLPIRSVP